MDRMIYVGNGRTVNSREVKGFGWGDGGKTKINLKDDEVIEVNTYPGLKEELCGSNHIVQICPCSKPLKAEYLCENGQRVYEKVEYLALCADGTVKGMYLSDGSIELVDDVDSFIGLVEWSQGEERE